jgi:polysaccharide export outer membrane protein
MRRIAGFVFALVALLGAQSALADTSISPGDILDVQVFGEPTLSQQLTVARDGSVTMPLVGRVIVRGMSTTQTASTIASGLKRYLRAPIVAVGIKTEGLYTVLVLGNVKTPGRYTVQPGSRLTDALAAAGGLGPVNGPLPAARVSVHDVVHEVSLDALLRKGDLTADLPLADASAIYVPAPATIRVRVLGAVDHPGDVEVNQGDRLAVAVAKAGNSANANADLNHIKVTRVAPGGASSVVEVNLYRALQDGDLSTDLVLKTDDIVFVPESKRKVDGFSLLLGAIRRLVLPF